MVDYQVTTSPSIKDIIGKWEILTFPNLRKKTQKHQLKEPLISVLAIKEKQLVGLLLVESKPEHQAATIISFLVIPPERNKGIGTHLLQLLDRGLLEKGYNRVDVVYQSNWKSRKALEKLLKSQGWKDPQQRMILSYAHCENYRQAPWINYDQLPQSYKIFVWSGITAEERRQIQEKQNTGWYPPELDPFQESDKLMEDLSVGLKHQGEVIGWNMTHSISPDTLQRTCFFLDSNHRLHNLALALSSKIIKLQMETDIPKSMFQVSTTNQHMMAYFDRYLKDYQDTITEVFWATKKIT